jgi:hypothetical protein
MPIGTSQLRNEFIENWSPNVDHYANGGGGRELMSTQADILREKYAALQAKGALDIKFCFGPLAEETSESVCASINEALDAVAAGEYDTLPSLGDSRRN